MRRGSSDRARPAGPTLSLVWRGFYLSQLMGCRNRAELLVDWFNAFFVSRDTAKLDVDVGVGVGPSLTDDRQAVCAMPAGSGPVESGPTVSPEAGASATTRWSGRV